MSSSSLVEVSPDFRPLWFSPKMTEILFFLKPPILLEVESGPKNSKTSFKTKKYHQNFGWTNKSWIPLWKSVPHGFPRSIHTFWRWCRIMRFHFFHNTATDWWFTGSMRKSTRELRLWHNFTKNTKSKWWLWWTKYKILLSTCKNCAIRTTPQRRADFSKST